MEATYTYTARSAEDPSQVITFTLHDHRMSVEPGVPLEHLEEALQSIDDEEAPDEDQEGYSPAWVKPTAVSLLERRTGPFNVGDLDASLEDDRLQVTAWVRVGGLLLAPILFKVAQVDNPDAAQAFVQELKRRQGSAEQSGKFPGLMDYWGGWLLVGLLALVLFLWPHEKESE